MPATAGRVRMPANNRVHSSAALQTHSIWQSAIGYDPYAPNKVNKPNSVNKEADNNNNNKGAPQAVPSSDPDAGNAYNSFQGLLALARVTNSNADEARGCCKMCGRVGHLSFQCRNFLSIKDDKDKDLEAIEAAVLAGLDKVKGKGKRRDGVESSEESSEESESSDSDYDSEIERAIAKNKKYGKNVSSLLKKSSFRMKKKKKKKDESDDEGRKKRSRSRKRRSGKKAESGSDTEDERRHGRRREKRRRRRSRREAEGSGSSEGSDTDRRRERRSRRAAEDYNVSSSLEDSRVGRDGKKRYEKESRKQRYEREI